MTAATLTLTSFLLARIAEDEAAWSGGLDLVTRPDFARLSRHMLARCRADRRAIDAAWSDHEWIEGEWGMCQSREQMDAKGDVPEVVAHLASVYADHPDYRDEWKP